MCIRDRFYIGGANSIRAFTVRSIGPGSYRPEDKQYGYLDETGDVKLEANVEYRFPILGDLYGAAFLDAGNVWLLREQCDHTHTIHLCYRHYTDILTISSGRHRTDQS